MSENMIMENGKISAQCYAKMIAGGAANLQEHVQEINDLNVFPIPDGDTGENMLLTMLGGAKLQDSEEDNLSALSRKISNAMLLTARGNSGVILSQFFDGITRGFSHTYEADVEQLKNAFKMGVEQAYKSVMTPTEGTILTVIREATEASCVSQAKTPLEFLETFLDEAKKSLEHTPDLLPVLKEAGVVDSGGAGLVYIIEGMKMAMLGKKIGEAIRSNKESAPEELDLDAFDENSVLTYGYCTEVLLRLQTAKVGDTGSFNESVIVDYLGTIGDSMVVVKSGSVVKIHVHTMTPHNVLGFLQQYGEFLKVKIENMSLQHNNTIKENTSNTEKPAPKKPRKPVGVVTVAQGEGVKAMFTDLGADYIVDGGQSMNPSAEDFLHAFDEVNADTIFVFPNNGNIVMAAKQAGELYEGSKVIVIESKTIGQGYASLSMLDVSMDLEETVAQLNEAMQEVVTAEITYAVRDTNMNGVEVKKDDYIGIVGKKIITADKTSKEAVINTLDKLGFGDYCACILVSGKAASEESVALLEGEIAEKYPSQEVYVVNGGQDVYEYILIIN